MYFALKHVCRLALDAGRLTKDQAQLYFERNFRPMRIAKLGDSAGLLTGYYEPIVDGSRFPTPMFKVPIYRRPPDLVPPLNSAGVGFPNKGTSLRRTSNGELVPYYDRGEILDGALDGQHLEICWIKDQADALMIQIEGAARVRLEDGTMLRINYDAHNGYQFVPVSRILIERNIIPRQEMSLERIREWMRANPENAEELRRQNRSFVFFRIVGLSDEREAVGAQGIPLTPGQMPPGSGSGSYIDTSSVTPGVSLPLVPAIRISIPSPSTNVACAVLPAMRIATERPLQHTRNDKLRQWGGSRGSIPSISLFRSRPAKPRIIACQRPPSPAIRMPPALFGSSSRSAIAAWRRKRRAVSVSPSRAATSAWIPALNELPWAQRGS
jgi:hypothetical protein